VYLWRGIDQNGLVLDIVVQKRRKRFLKRLLLGPAAYIACHCHGQAQELRRGKVRASSPIRAPTKSAFEKSQENSHRPTPAQKRQIRWFKSLLQEQRFLSLHAMIHGQIHTRRHRMTASRYRSTHRKTFIVSKQATWIQTAA
jgi:putative transposase